MDRRVFSHVFGILSFLIVLSVSMSLVGAYDCFGESFSCSSSEIPICEQHNGYIEYGCEPDPAQCANNPKYSLDCNLWCDEGFVIDYSRLVCCPATVPFVDDNAQYCLSSPTSLSNNFYTRNSNCDSGGTKCVGNDFYDCNEEIKFLWKFENNGPISGKCGVECTGDQEKCDGRNFLRCNNFEWDNLGVSIGKCGSECLSGSKCVGSSLFECESNVWTDKGNVPSECGFCNSISDCSESVGPDGQGGKFKCEDSLCVWNESLWSSFSRWFMRTFIGGVDWF